MDQLAAEEPILKAPSYRISKLGSLGEELAEEALLRNGFEQVRNLNDSCHNQPFADLLAEKQGSRYFIGVKARNEKQANGMLNASYNCVLVANDKNNALKAQGKTTEDITRLTLERVQQLADKFSAIPAWIAVPIRPEERTYAVYFGLLEELGIQRSIPMTHTARMNYQCLVDWVADDRITPELTNQV